MYGVRSRYQCLDYNDDTHFLPCNLLSLRVLPADKAISTPVIEEILRLKLKIA